MELTTTGALYAWIAGHDKWSVLFTLSSLWVIGIAWSAIYNVYFHPLRKYPGPKLSAAFSFPFLYSRLVCHDLHHVRRLHLEYGDVVRIGPDALSFVKPSAWKDIYDKTVGKAAIIRHRRMYNGWNIEPNMANANGPAHAKQRKVFAAAFSGLAVKEYEPMLQKHTQRLILKLADVAEEENIEAEMCQLYTRTTAHIMAELTGSRPTRKNTRRESIAEGVYHTMIISRRYLIFGWLYTYLVALPLLLLTYEMSNFSAEQVKNRREGGTDANIWRFAQKDAEGNIAMSQHEMNMNVELLLFAGAETTATLLSAVTFFLLQNKEAMRKLVKELDAAFANDGDLTLNSLVRVRYLTACLKESLRLHPPAPSNMLRMLPAGGAIICGEALPGGTEVSVAPYTAYRLPKYWTDPESFVPERWLGDPKYDSDAREICQPFSVGAQNCLGMVLAWHEARLILASVLLKFDFVLGEDSQEWATGQRASIVWDKKPFMATVKMRSAEIN
ncbi:cytochrome P450 [Rhizodiscina lignyota]|uniref:Cytochrome P450 n=1 Tax=Rhizodiscina lignyota TaxID=1504668 RepID=A0A9P4I2Y0_9PEZI|nr:cytochrome P450 [Rhizodiscina lignyota]